MSASLCARQDRAGGLGARLRGWLREAAPPEMVGEDALPVGLFCTRRETANASFPEPRLCDTTLMAATMAVRMETQRPPRVKLRRRTPATWPRRRPARAAPEDQCGAALDVSNSAASDGAYRVVTRKPVDSIPNNEFAAQMARVSAKERKRTRHPADPSSMRATGGRIGSAREEHLKGERMSLWS